MKARDREKKILFILVLGISKKELIDAIVDGAKLSKADAGKVIAILPKVVINQVVYIDAKIAHRKLTKADKIALIDAIAASAKLTKADAGRVMKVVLEAVHGKLKTVFGGKGQ